MKRDAGWGSLMYCLQQQEEEQHVCVGCATTQWMCAVLFCGFVCPH